MVQGRRLKIVRTTRARRKQILLLILIVPCLVFLYIGISARSHTLTYCESRRKPNNSRSYEGEDISTCCVMRHTRRRKAVVIIAEMRSGSSFLGEFFNQHSEIYYLFEPLHGIGHGRNSSAKRKELLHDLLKCDYTRVPTYYQNATEDEWTKCSHNICFKDRSKFLWRQSDLCKRPPPYCGNYVLDPYILGMICRRSLFPVIKIIRVSLLRELESILIDPELDLRVIQLVRDPRAIVSSRMKTKMFLDDPETFVGNIIKLCSSMHTNFKYAETCIFEKVATEYRNSSDGAFCSAAMSKLWKGRFMRISHEYLSEQPFEAWKDLYSFTELNYDSEVFEWIKSHTTKTPPDSPPRKKVPGNYYDTSRNSTKVLNAWRRQLSPETVRSIQATCAPAMKVLGYSLINNDDDQLNLAVPLYNFDASVKTSWSTSA